MNTPLKLSSPEARQKEVKIKLIQLRELMRKHEITALRFRGVDWFSWITAGGNSWVILTNETGVAEVFITFESAFILTPIIETQRMIDEEVPALFEITSLPWQDPQAYDNFITDKLNIYLKKSTTKRSCVIASERPQGHEIKLPFDFHLLKMKLLSSEILRYRQMGRLAAEAMTSAMQAALSTWSEQDLAAEGAKQLLQRGLEPTLILVSGEKRLTKYRHPLPGNHILGNLAMMVFCARKEGLYANLTRFVAFNEVSPKIQNQFNQLMEIESEALAHSLPGENISKVYKEIKKAYSLLNVGDEINYHHQGVLTGYLSRDLIASPLCSQDHCFPLQPGMAFAWNPSLPGAKIEDTMPLTDSLTQPLEILTVDPQWPTQNYKGYQRPLVLKKY